MKNSTICVEPNHSPQKTESSIAELKPLGGLIAVLVLVAFIGSKIMARI